MLWWIFIPASYFAVAVDLVCADLITWRGSSVAFLVLLWSFVAMRSDSRKALMQAGVLARAEATASTRARGRSLLTARSLGLF